MQDTEESFMVQYITMGKLYLTSSEKKKNNTLSLCSSFPQQHNKS